VELIADESGVVAAAESPKMDTYSSPGARIAEAMDLVEQAQALLSTGLQLVSDAGRAQQEQEQAVEAELGAGFGSKQPQALHMIRGHPGESLSHAAAAAVAPSAAVTGAASKALEVLQEAQQRREQVGLHVCWLRDVALACAADHCTGKPAAFLCGHTHKPPLPGCSS
jgi:hypothetical protein